MNLEQHVHLSLISNGYIHVTSEFTGVVLYLSVTIPQLFVHKILPKTMYVYKVK